MFMLLFVLKQKVKETLYDVFSVAFQVNEN